MKIRHLVKERAPYDLVKFKIVEVKELQHVRKLTLLSPRVLVPTPSTKDPHYLKNNKCYKPETFRGVRGTLQDFKKFQVDITIFAW